MNFTAEEGRVSQIMSESEFFKDIKDKELFSRKLIKVYCIDIGKELRKMDLWLWANPNKRYRNYKRFIVNWIARKDLPYGKY